MIIQHNAEIEIEWGADFTTIDWQFHYRFITVECWREYLAGILIKYNH